MTATRRTPALALRVFDFAETSQVLHLFTRDMGRVHGLAKGAKRLGGAFGGGVDVLAYGEASVYERRGESGLRTLGAFRTTDTFPRLRESLARFHAAEHVAALLLGFTREEQPMEGVFDVAVAALRLVEACDDAQAQAVALGFEAMLLTLTGFFPELSRCAACARPARNVRTARLSPSQGGLLCSRCASVDPRAARVDGATVSALAKLGAGPLAAAVNLPATAALRTGLRAALDEWTTHVLDRPLATSRWL